MAKISLRIGNVTVDEKEFREVFQSLRRSNQLETVLNSIRIFSAHAERRLRAMLAKQILTDPSVAAKFQYQQGRLDGTLEVLKAIHAWSLPVTPKQDRPEP